MPSLLPAPVLAAVFAAVGCAAGPFISSLAARRAVKQPLALALDDEGRLLSGVLGELRRLPYLATLKPEDFAVGSHARIWAALLTTCGPQLGGLGEEPDDDTCAEVGAELDVVSATILSAVNAELAAGPAPAGDTTRLADLCRDARVSPLDDAKVVESGNAVLATGSDRNRHGGFGLVLPTATPDSTDPGKPPLQRVLLEPGRARKVLTSLALAAAAAVLPAFVHASGFSGIGTVLACLALLTLLAGSALIALVDLETFTLDLPSFALLTGASWALTVAADASRHAWARPLNGVFVVAAVACLFEGANFVYKRVRGVDGQGFGDTLIVLATVGIPPAIAGNWTLGYYSLMAGLVVAIIGWTIGAVRQKLGRTTPFAFGPYLAAGWVVGWVTFLLFGGLL
jgi:hypothetical protein